MLDGRGYKNIVKDSISTVGSPKEFAETNVFLLNGTAEVVELFELELCDKRFYRHHGENGPGREPAILVATGR